MLNQAPLNYGPLGLATKLPIVDDLLPALSGSMSIQSGFAISLDSLQLALLPVEGYGDLTIAEELSSVAVAPSVASSVGAVYGAGYAASLAIVPPAPSSALSTQNVAIVLGAISVTAKATGRLDSKLTSTDFAGDLTVYPDQAESITSANLTFLYRNIKTSLPPAQSIAQAGYGGYIFSSITINFAIMP